MIGKDFDVRTELVFRDSRFSTFLKHDFRTLTHFQHQSVQGGQSFKHFGLLDVNQTHAHKLKS